MLAAVVVTAGVALGTGLILGGATALVGLWMTPDMPGLTAFMGRAYWLMAAFMPLALWLGIYMTYDEAEHAEAYGSPLGVGLTILQAAVVGAGLGAGPFYIAAATYVPVLFSGYEVAVWSVALRDQLLWTPWLVVVGATLLAALPLTYWAYRTGPAGP